METVLLKAVKIATVEARIVAKTMPAAMLKHASLNRTQYVIQATKIVVAQPASSLEMEQFVGQVRGLAILKKPAVVSPLLARLM